MTGGTGVHRHIYGDDPLRAYAVILIRPGDWHQYLACRELELFNLYLGPEMLDHELAWLKEEPGYQFLYTDTWNRDPNRITRSIPVQPEGAGHALRALGALEGHGSRNRIEAIGHLLHFLGALREDFRAGAGKEAPSRMHPAVARGTQLMSEDLRAAWTLAALSAKLNGINPSYLSRLFKEQTGQAPMTWLARARAERAATLLRRTTEDIAAVGHAVGWSDPNYFSRRFRQFFGTAPSRYRRSS